MACRQRKLLHTWIILPVKHLCSKLCGRERRYSINTVSEINRANYKLPAGTLACRSEQGGVYQDGTSPHQADFAHDDTPPSSQQSRETGAVLASRGHENNQTMPKDDRLVLESSDFGTVSLFSHGGSLHHDDMEAVALF